MNTNVKMTDIIEESFATYAGAVAQSRAFVDVRDCLKPSARQIEYCLYTDKFHPNKPFKKTLKAIGSIARLYIHGDSSAEGIMMRSGQEFAMRYPLTEIEGNNGNLMQSGNWAAPRYTATRLSAASMKLFEDVNKNTIEEWRDNYDDTEKYPAVLPSKGFYNIVNGSSGIGVGVASSIPQFNIKDVNKALETLLLNPECSFDDIYCCPDFATGAYLINEEEVREALKYGSKHAAKSANEEGAACKLRSVIDYDEKENCLIVKEIPYGVYTNTICGQLEAIVEDEENPGIDRFNDLTGETPYIKIYLSKGANYLQIINYLYQNTSLQYHYSINMTMLENGRFPKVFTWKEALQSHIDHEINVYTRGFEFDLNKIRTRIHILDGLLICLASIEEVIQTIKSSSSTADASKALQNKFMLDEEQAKAVLDMKLARLASLEVKKLENEKTELSAEAAAIEAILNDRNLLNQELIKGWRETAAKMGDERRTKSIKVAKPSKEEKEAVQIVPEDVVVVMTQTGEIKRVPKSNFKKQRKAGKGTKSEGDAILDTISTNTIDKMMFFSNKGKMYQCVVDNIPSAANSAKGVHIGTLVKMDKDERIIAMSSLQRKSMPKYIIFITASGMIKKSLLSEYTSVKKNTGIQAIKLGEGDTIASVNFMDEEEMIVVSHAGMAIRFTTKDINPIGRVAAGVKSIKLGDEDYVIAGLPVHKITDRLAVVTESGMGKKVALEEFNVQGRNGKGVIAAKEPVAGVAMVDNDDNLLLVGQPTSICFGANEMPELGRTAQGNMMIKNSKVKRVVKF